MAKIPNPPTNLEPGKTAEWDGNEWQIVDVVANVLPMPLNIPEGYKAFWNGAAWDIVEIPPTPEPTPEQISEKTLLTGLSALQSVAYLTTPEIERHVSAASKAVLAGYIDAVAEIVRLAQEAIRAGKKFEVEIPPLPNVDPLRLTDSGSGFVEFIKPE